MPRDWYIVSSVRESDETRDVRRAATRDARALGDARVHADHLLRAVIEHHGQQFSRALQAVAVDRRELDIRLNAELSARRATSKPPGRRFARPLTLFFLKAMSYHQIWDSAHSYRRDANIEARIPHREGRIAVEDLVRALASHPVSPLARALESAGVAPEAFVAAFRGTNAGGT